MLRLSILLNQVWGLQGCHSFLPPAYESLSQVRVLRVYRAVGFYWSVMSFYTTVGVIVLEK